MNRGSLVQIRVAANIEFMQIRIVIMFTKFICQNDFRPLSTIIRVLGFAVKAKLCLSVVYVFTGLCL